jgi:LmbE family N-acetylglucosaminyl deacetylase
MEKKELKIHIESKPVNNLVVIDKSNSKSESFLNYIHSRENIVVFSPHLDDAVLSAGSLISYASGRGIPVEVITLFSEGTDLISTATKTLLRNAEFTDAKVYFEARRVEDKVALNELGTVKVRHLHYIDSAWRKSEKGDSLYSDSQLAEIDTKDNALHHQLVSTFKTLLSNTDKTGIFAPLGRGKHVDHQLTRDVSKEIFPQTIFYEDFPYSAYYENEDSFITENNLVPVEWKGDYEAKKRAILQYKTQRYSLFYKGTMFLPYERFFFNFQ